MTPKPLLEVRGLYKRFPVRGRRKAYVQAVNGVDFELPQGATLGIVGESGCGKSTLGRSVLRLIEPSAGSVLFDGIDVLAQNPAGLRALRRQMQIVFQDPFASLDPRFSVAKIIAEPLVIHAIGTARERRQQVADLLDTVGLPADAASRYPHEFSGGQRQRIAIARAIALQPKLIVADEPVSALDVSIQSQILNLLSELRRQRGLSYLFISHDLAVVEHISDQVAVMYLGRIMELTASATLFAQPAHPYTQVLIQSIPRPELDPDRARVVLSGEIPDPESPPPGCPFHPRCPQAMDNCRGHVPELKNIGSVHTPHWVRCHLY